MKKITSLFITRALFLFISCGSLLACAKSANPDLMASDLAGKLCNVIHYKCNPDSGSVQATSDELACNEKLRAELTTYIQMNNIKMKQSDFDLCLSHAETAPDCEGLQQGNIVVPEGCEAFSGWFNK